MALYKDGNPVSGLNSIPRLTLAQYNALNVKPEFWVRTDAPESYKRISADEVSYDNTESGLSSTDVQDAIDEVLSNLTADDISVTPNTTYTGTFVVRAYSFGRFFFITGYMQISTQIPKNTQVATINLNGKTLLQELYITSKASDSSDVVRMKITTDGKLQSESIIPNGSYYSFSCFGVLSV